MVEEFTFGWSVLGAITLTGVTVAGAMLDDRRVISGLAFGAAAIFALLAGVLAAQDIVIWMGSRA